jgi:tRNA dimethylallyltransferase
MGPTAAGKTDVAVALVERGPFEIVSVDSAMVYRGMDIGTGKPEPAVLARAPHRLVDIRDPDQPYSAAEFARDAHEAIAAIRERGRVPLLVGGTGLYFRALRQGLSPLPQADARVRARLEARAEREGWPALHRALARVDPAAAARIHPNDPQRIQRALEVHAITGRAMSELMGSRRMATRRGAAPLLVGCTVVLEPADRAWLHERIERRFHAMLERGLIDEVRGLRARWALDPGLPSMRAVGYRQAWQHLEGACSRAELTRRALAATRQLARRQLTWLRAERGVERLDCAAPDLGARVLALLHGGGVV